MGSDDNSLFGLGGTDTDAILPKLLSAGLGSPQSNTNRRKSASSVPAKFGQFKELPEYKQLQVQLLVAEKMDILRPYFTCHDGLAKGTTMINGEKYINFSTYDYVGLNGHPKINAAAAEAMKLHGTSAGASRLVAGERPEHGQFEKALADVYGTESALVFVSGHATNVSTISTLLGPRDAVYHDALAHNSLILGATLSGSARYSYPHNDNAALEKLLQQTRSKYERVLIVTEGLFSMDGNVPDLPELIRIKKQYTCFLMVDEAHSLGVLGATGHGVAEHFGIPSTDVDIWMGTLSKTLCGCGGFIAGCKELIDLLKFRAPGFVFSVGLPPPIAAASCKALEIMLLEPERTRRLQQLSKFFLVEAQKRNLDTGHAKGFGIIPLLVGNSLVAGVLSALLFKRHINVLPIIYPAVEEGMARLRFFLSSEHNEEDIVTTLDAILEELPKAQSKAL